MLVLQRIKWKLSILSNVPVFHHALHRKGEPAWLAALASHCLPTMSGCSTPKHTHAVCRSHVLSCIICVKELVANSCREQGGSEHASQSGSDGTWSVLLRFVGRQCREPGMAACLRACTSSPCKQRKAREECIAQSRNACPIPGSVPSQFGQGFKQAGPVKCIPAQDGHGRGFGATWFLTSLPTQTILCLYDSVLLHPATIRNSSPGSEAWDLKPAPLYHQPWSWGHCGQWAGTVAAAMLRARSSHF